MKSIKPRYASISLTNIAGLGGGWASLRPLDTLLGARRPSDMMYCRQIVSEHPFESSGGSRTFPKAWAQLPKTYYFAISLPKDA